MVVQQVWRLSFNCLVLEQFVDTQVQSRFECCTQGYFSVVMGTIMPSIISVFVSVVATSSYS